MRLGLKYVEDFKQRIPRKEAEMLIQTVADAADTAYGKNQVPGEWRQMGCKSINILMRGFPLYWCSTHIFNNPE